MLRIGFVGFRHPHIMDLHQRCLEHEAIQIVACCEEDAATREVLQGEGSVQITHDVYATMLGEVECDVLAVGDYYTKRGDLILEALSHGCHVLGDKPLCTSLEQLDQIQTLAEEQGCVVGCMLDMRDGPVFLKIRELIRNGRIGEVQAIQFGGQHPLMHGTRPGWYFEEGKHGGTLNDIAVHALDLIPWITGEDFAAIHSARCWGSALPDLPHFKECGQAMMSLDNGAGVLCDVSYLMPDSFGYTHPLYWRFTFWGTEGVLEAGYNQPDLKLWANGQDACQSLEPSEGKPGAYLDAFIQEVTGEVGHLHLSSSESLAAARLGLQLQEAADQHQAQVVL